MAKLRVLFATSEAYPVIKTGGLADISHALPYTLQSLGVDARILLPGYKTVLEQLRLKPLKENLQIFDCLPPIRILEGMMLGGDIPVYVIDCPSLYYRDGGPYQDEEGEDWQDNHLRFGLLSKVAALFGEHLFNFKPNVIHCNDWQTGLAPAYLHFSKYAKAKTMMSVHNLAHQGVFGAETVDLLHLPQESFSMYGLEYYGLMSFLKAGLYYSDWITTVSPTYAREIQTPNYGYGLYDLLSNNQHRLTGILNGINEQEWNPETDAYLMSNYDHTNFSAKSKNTRALRQRLGLESPKQTPLIGMITRLTHQKGIDLVVPIIPHIINEGAQLVLLGSGDKDLEERLQILADEYVGYLSVNFGYDEELAHQIEASADIFLMPSRFEPCGLNQMYSMRYGTVPIVRNTGGLADTVVDTTPSHLDTETATGFIFEREDAYELLHCVQRALVTYRDKATWRQLRTNGMCKDFSWQYSTQSYIELYENLIQQEQVHEVLPN
ncbi:MAG: glycogen synthase GlgA [Thiotrichaceae bacterium]|nr:glycogen synthase GlgA [Thiotrichaceae bacterium]